jgi:type IX secretion system PorP/SprF family membrane protein
MKPVQLFIIALGCLTGATVSAQQKPYFTQYIINNYVLNPAITGIENYTDLKLSYRDQWTDIPGAPKTMYLTIHAPINKADYRTTATSFGIPGENPRGKAYWEEYTTPESHSGVGLQIMNDKTGYITRSSVYLTYAYHKGLTSRMSLSAGFLGGGSKVSLDRSKIEWATLDPNDPSIGYNASELKKVKPEVGVGLWLYGASGFLGASVLNIVPGKVKFSAMNNTGGSFVPEYMATAGYRFFMTDEISILPSVMVQYINPFALQIHFNAKMQYMDRIWLGASYRKSDDLGGYAAMAGVNISNFFNVSYAYDQSNTSRLRYYTRSTHEIILGFLLNNKYGDTCPRNIW